MALVAAIGALLAGSLMAAPSSALAVDTTFTPVALTGSPLFVTSAETDFWINSAAPADVDGDGDLDLAVLGYYVVYHESAEDILVVFRNDGPDGAGGWSFTEQRVPLGPLYAGASDLAWGDYDGDLDPDLVVGTEGATALFRNDAGTLRVVDAVLPGYSEDSSYSGAYDLRSLTWADIDNDADLDLLIPSVWDSETFEYSTHLLRNDGPVGADGWLFSETGAVLDPTAHAQSAWADDDADDDLDLFLASADPYTDLGFVRRYENAGGTFVASDLLGIQVQYGSADWGDYDQDGDLDILVAGNILDADDTYRTVLRIYRNDGGTYVAEDLAQGFREGDWLLDIHAATWADYDSDGDTDVLMTGSWVDPGVEIFGKSQVYVNDGGVFAPLAVELPAPISSIGQGGAFTWFDLDGDGDLDYLVAGAYYVPGGNGLVESQLNVFSNDASTLNAPPSAPTRLSATPTGHTVDLAWAAATDDGTVPEALTYELVVRPVTAPAASISAAERLPEPGTLGAVTGWRLSGLDPGAYRWSVAAVDSAFNGSERASGTFTIPEVDVTITPGSPRPVVPAGGGKVAYSVTATNLTAGPRAVDLWVTSTTPDGVTTTVKQVTRSLPAGASMTLRAVQVVGAEAPAGLYTQTAVVGGAGSSVAFDTSSFTFAKRRA